MHNKDLFYDYFYYSETSPSKFRWKPRPDMVRDRDDTPVINRKKRNKTDPDKIYVLQLRVDGKQYNWSVHRVLYELYNNKELGRHDIIIFSDNNTNNLEPSNLILTQHSCIPNVHRNKTYINKTDSNKYSLRKRIQMTFDSEEECDLFSEELNQLLFKYGHKAS